MTRPANFFLILTILFLSNCGEKWDDYYYRDPGETVDRTVWEIINEDPDYSIFTGLIKENNMDSVFTSGRSVTVFVPANEAFEGFNPDSMDIRTLLNYHFLDKVINIHDIEKSRLIETFSKKFALIEKESGSFYIDGNEIVYFSPLCTDGRFFGIKNVLFPKPTLYEFISDNSSIYKEYIDSFEEIILDLDKSVPLGFDEQGNTIYDSVFTIVNHFDERFFPVNTESRKQSATVVLFDQQQYQAALNEMAGKLGDSFTDYNDIPDDWQFEELLPRVVRNGIFEGSLQYSDFLKGKLKNIAGDSVRVDYTSIDADSRFILSNGVVFKYKNFTVPEELYLLERKIQGEHLVKPLGSGIYGWKEGVNVTGSSTNPARIFSTFAENDSVISLSLGPRYAGNFMMEFTIPRVFPQRYRLEWRASNRPSGVYEVYVNDEKVGEFDLFLLRNVVMSVTGEMFIPSGGYNSKDFEVNNLTEYGDVKIGIKYIGSGSQTNNGLTMDYMALIPF